MSHLENHVSPPATRRAHNATVPRSPRCMFCLTRRRRAPPRSGAREQSHLFCSHPRTALRTRLVATTGSPCARSPTYNCRPPTHPRRSCCLAHYAVWCMHTHTQYTTSTPVVSNPVHRYCSGRAQGPVQHAANTVVKRENLRFSEVNFAMESVAVAHVQLFCHKAVHSFFSVLGPNTRCGQHHLVHDFLIQHRGLDVQLDNVFHCSIPNFGQNPRILDYRRETR